MKQNGVSDDAMRLFLFPYSLMYHAIACYDRLPRNSIHSSDYMMRKFLSKYFPPSMVTKLRNKITKFEQKLHKSLFEAWEHYKFSIDRCPNHNMLLVTQIDMFYNGLTLSHRDTINYEAVGTFMQKTPEECYELIENMTAHHNHWDTSAIRDETSRNISSTSTTESLKVVQQLEMMNKNFLEMMRQFQTVKTVDTKCETCGGPIILPSAQPSMATLKTPPMLLSTQNNQIMNILTNMKMQNTLGSGSLPSNTVANLRGDLKAITTRSGVSYDETPVPPLFSSLPTAVERVPEVTKDTVQLIVDYVVDPRVPLILGRPFFRTRRALIDVYYEELTLRVDDEAITFKFGQTSKYSYKDAELINQINVIDVACEEYIQEGGDFVLEEIEACLTSKSISLTIDDTDFGLVGDIYLLEELLNNDPSSSPLPPKELNVEEIKTVKSSIDEPPKLELKELPSHFEYVFLEGTDKLPVIISKELKDEEKSALAIAWKIFDIKGLDPRFCTHKILIEDDFKPTVQHYRRVNPKIHEVIKKEVIKLLNAGLIYPISDSPWVSPVHCVPKKGVMTVFKNKDNELIPTRLVTGWRVCIDY
nr:reverse transcriptase domain-containing protein [Tanacetum cinerariifolium]